MKRNATAKRFVRALATGPVLARARIWSMATVLMILPVTLIWHLARLQVMPNEEKGFVFLQEQGEARTLREEKIPAYRGMISDRNGEILAVSTPVQSIVLNPQKFKVSDAEVLAQALGLHKGELTAKIGRYSPYQFMYVARNLPPHEAHKALVLNLDGVWAENGFKRYYPAGEVTAHLIGYTDAKDNGGENSDGIEHFFNQILAGSSGSRRVLKNLKGQVVKELGIARAAVSGNDLSLSIDLRLQYLAYRELKKSIIEQGAKTGSIVMLDVTTGEVLAMTNYPSYNPNNREHLDSYQARNLAVTDLLEPGSTMKPFTAIAALESKRWFPTTIIDTNPGYWQLAGKTYKDHHNFGVIDLSTALQKSSQVAFTKIAMDLPAENLRDIFVRVGLGQMTGAGFSGEVSGRILSPKKWHPSERAALAFGHGLTATPLQIAQAYTVFGTQGILRPVSLTKIQKAPNGARVMEKQYAQQVLDMMKRVTETGGTATRAQIKAYPTAGKTGTAHKVGDHGYQADKYMALFAGLIPADDPKIVMVVVVNEPPTDQYYGGLAAAPIFAKVGESAMRLMQVPPHINPVSPSNVATR